MPGLLVGHDPLAARLWVADSKDKFVGFNLRSIKHIRFTQTEEFAKLLRKNLERFFHLAT
jgi:hypothetical protein